MIQNSIRNGGPFWGLQSRPGCFTTVYPVEQSAQFSMRTAAPFHSFAPKKYIKQRYAPLYATVVDPEVEKIFKLCGLTFTDFVAANAAKLPNPARVVEHTTILQETQNAFLSNVANETMLFSQSFAQC